MKKLMLIIMGLSLLGACHSTKQTKNQDETKAVGVNETNAEQSENAQKSALPTSVQDSEKTQIKDEVPKNLEAPKVDPPKLNPDMIVGDETITLPEFAVKVELDEGATQKMTTLKETLIVAAYFTVPLGSEDVPESYRAFMSEGSMPEIFVATQKVELELSNLRAEFKGITYERKLYDVLRQEDRDIHLLINIYSGRRSNEMNILDCDILSDKMSKLGGNVYTLKCKALNIVIPPGL